MNIDEPATDAHAQIAAQLNTLSDALTNALQTHAQGLPMALVVGVIECVKLDAHLSVLGRLNAAPGDLQ